MTKSREAFRTISEVSDWLETPAHVLRFWESKFTQVKPVKRAGGRRYYRPEDVNVIRQIQNLLYNQGYTIRGVQKLLKENRGVVINRISTAAPAVAAQVESAVEKVGSLGLAVPAQAKASGLSAKKREELRKQQEELRRQQEIEQQRMQQLEDIRRQRAEAARLTAEREKQLAQARDAQRATEILNQQAEPDQPVGSQRPGQDVANDLLSQYAGLIQEVVTQNWRRPANTPTGIRCVLRVRQIPGGEVIGVTVGSPCNADPLIQQSIIDAVERASPLPYMGFESVFQPALNFNFRYDG